MNDNSPLAVDTGRGFSINYLGKNLYSKYNPSKTPERIAQSIVFKEETLYIVPSPLLLYGIDILSENIPESSFILGIEIDQKLMKISLENSISINHKGFKFVRLHSREQIQMIINDLGIWRFRRSELIPLNNGYNLYKDDYDYLFNFSSFLLSTFWRNRLTINKLGPLWIKNTLINIPSITKGSPDNQGKAVVICGAGSSLEDSLELIKKYREDIYIMAVDTALAPLIESGIIPDIVFALEAQFYNLGDFYNLSDYKIDLLTDITGYPQVCREMNGQKYFLFTEFYENNLFSRMENNDFISIKIPPLGSVGVAALNTALEIFKSDIFLTGLDFSFTPGKSHCKNSPFTNSLLRNSNRMTPANSYKMALNRTMISMKGKTPDSRIITDRVLDSYAKLLIDIISRTNRVYDLSSKGYPLGAELIDEKRFSEMLIENSKRSSLSHPGNESQINTTDFLNNESLLLGNLIREWEKFSNSQVDEIPESLMKSLKKVDYVYVDFPDRLPHPQKNVSFVSRAVLAARKYKELIRKIIQ